MKTYIVQYRLEHGGRLRTFGHFEARDSTSALCKGARALSAMRLKVVELIATEQ